MNPYPSVLKLILRFLAICCSVLAYSTAAQAQAIIASVSPSSALQGEQQQIVIKGLRTHFKQAGIHIDLGQGVLVQNVLVSDQETIILHALVDNNANPGPRVLTISTGAEIVSVPNAYQILARQGFNAAFTLYPVQYLSTAYFNPGHIQSSPQLFSVSITNNAVPRDISMILTIVAAEYGSDPIISGNMHVIVSAGAQINVNSRQFIYTLSNTSMEPYATSTQSGNLPGGTYTFRLQVFDRGNSIADNTASMQVSNPMNRPELIYPGASFSSAPMQIQSRQPLFQWVGQATTYDIAIYPVLKGQVLGEEAVLNRPVFEQKGISQNSFLYPAFAQLLEEGKTYTWQLTTHNYAATPLKSEMKWFTVYNTSMPLKSVHVTRIMVNPENVNIRPGATFHFSLNALNDDRDTVKVNPIWKVIPSDAGTIDEAGNFTANKQEKEAVAIVALYQELTDYVTLTIKEEAIGKNKKP